MLPIWELESAPSSWLASAFCWSAAFIWGAGLASTTCGNSRTWSEPASALDESPLLSSSLSPTRVQCECRAASSLGGEDEFVDESPDAADPALAEASVAESESALELPVSVTVIDEPTPLSTDAAGETGGSGAVAAAGTSPS